MSSAMICRKCGATVQNCGGWLERVNEKGVPGIWECRPTCGSSLPQEQAVIDAILGDPEMSAQLLAERIARRIAEDIHQRKGIGDELDSCDAETQDEIMATWTAIIAEELTAPPNERAR